MKNAQVAGNDSRFAPEVSSAHGESMRPLVGAFATFWGLPATRQSLSMHWQSLWDRAFRNHLARGSQFFVPRSRVRRRNFVAGNYAPHVHNGNKQESGLGALKLEPKTSTPARSLLKSVRQVKGSN